MSEPDSGPTLASVRTRAEPVPGGFACNGTKVWTSGAHHNHYCITLVRTSGQHGDRHKGLSQLLVDLKTPGITIRPIINLAGRHDWNEVTFSDAFIPESCLIGNEGDGWLQVTSELAFGARPRALYAEFLHPARIGPRAGPPAGQAPPPSWAGVARLWTLRQMSVAVAGMMQGGKSPAIEAALVKDLGTIYQQDLPRSPAPRRVRRHDREDLADFLVAQYATMMAPLHHPGWLPRCCAASSPRPRPALRRPTMDRETRDMLLDPLTLLHRALRRPWSTGGEGCVARRFWKEIEDGLPLAVPRTRTAWAARWPTSGRARGPHAACAARRDRARQSADRRGRRQPGPACNAGWAPGAESAG
jgi:hypothetical protein